MWQGGDTHPSGCATRASLGLLASDDSASAKTEQPKNEQHDNHGADDIDDSIHDPFSCACRGHISYKKTFSFARLEARLASARRPEYFNADKRSRALRMNFRCLWTISRVAMLIQRNSVKRFRVQSDAYRPINKEKTTCRLAQS